MKTFEKKLIKFIETGKQYNCNSFTIQSSDEICIAIEKKDVEKINQLSKSTNNKYFKSKLENLLFVGYLPFENSDEFSEFVDFLHLNFNSYNIFKIIETVKEDTKIIQVSRKFSKKIQLIYNENTCNDEKLHLWDLIKFGECKYSESIFKILKENIINFKIKILDSLTSTFKKLLNLSKLTFKIFKSRAKHIASVSGGKDSCYMVLKMLENNMPLDELLFVDTGLELPEMYAYLNKFEKYIGIPIKRIHPDTTFEDEFFRTVSSGKNKGKIYGWPYTLGAWCNSRLKTVPLKKYLNNIGEHISYIGIAHNEPERYIRLKINEKAPLYEWGINEEQIIDEMKKLNLLNPLYEKFKRLGCYLCPKQNLDSLRTIRTDYPEHWKKMIYLDKFSPSTFRPNSTLIDLDIRFSKEDKSLKPISSNLILST